MNTGMKMFLRFLLILVVQLLLFEHLTWDHTCIPCRIFYSCCFSLVRMVPVPLCYGLLRLVFA